MIRRDYPRQTFILGQTDDVVGQACAYGLWAVGKRYGSAPPAVEAAIRAITDLDQLADVFNRVLDTGGWDVVVATP